jgi:hypothetical protein
MTDIDWQLQGGPCVICGLTNYPLSMGGPTICPSCDCGDFGPMKIERQRKEIERLKAAISYVRMRSAHACEILNEFDNTSEPKP